MEDELKEIETEDEKTSLVSTIVPVKDDGGNKMGSVV